MKVGAAVNKLNTNADAYRIAKMREYHSLLNTHSRNRLNAYTPFLLSYVTLLYVVTAILLFTQFVCEPFHLVDECIPAAPFPQTIVLADSFHCLTAGAFAAACAFVLIQIIDTEERSTLRHSQLYCTALINTVAFIGHLCIAMRTFPPVLNVFNREVYIPRLLEWISLVPMLMFMTFCLDIRSSSDSVWMWFFVISQQISVLTGCFANLTTNYTLAVALLTISCISFCSIYIGCYHMFRRMHLLAQADQNNLDDSSISGSSEQRLKEVLSKVENVGAVMSFQLVLYCAVFWTVIAATYFLGVLNFFDHNTEACIQACVDLLTKCFYTQVLCTSHGTMLNPEGLLMRLIVLEERANASFRQSIRFVFHELANPLNSISVGMDLLSYQQLSAEGKESLNLARTKCDAISDSLNDVKYLQSIENIASDIKFQPFDFSKTVRDCALVYVKIARDNGVKLVLEIDERIPELLLGDKTRLKPVIACLILNGINQSPHPGGNCIVSLTTPAEVIDATKKTLPLTFSVTDNGDGLSQSEYDSLDSPNSATAFSLTPFRKIIDAHSGTITVKTTPKGSCFIVEVELPLPALDRPNAPAVLNSPHHNSSESYTKSFERRTMTARTSANGPESASSLQQSKSMFSSDLTALVVDDVESNRLMTNKVLQLMGFTVVEAEDGDIAIDMCADREYTVVLIDNKMPRVSGVMAVKTIRAKGFKGIIIGLTGIVDEEELEEFEMSGCDAVITKPLDIAELKRTLLSLKVRLSKPQSR